MFHYRTKCWRMLVVQDKMENRGWKIERLNGNKAHCGLILERRPRCDVIISINSTAAAGPRGVSPEMALLSEVLILHSCSHRACTINQFNTTASHWQHWLLMSSTPNPPCSQRKCSHITYIADLGTQVVFSRHEPSW